MNMEYHGGAPVLLVDTGLGPVSYSLVEPRRPERMASGALVGGSPAPMAGYSIARAASAPRAYETSGQSMALLHTTAKSCEPEAQILSQDAAGGYRYVLERDRLEVQTNDGCEVVHLSISGARKLKVVRDRLAVTTEEGIAVFDICRPQAPMGGRVYRVPDVTDVQCAPVATARRAVFVRCSMGRGVVLDLDNPERPVVLTEYARRPWYADGARLGRLYARLDDERRRVTIYRLGESATGFERPPLVSEIWQRRGSPIAPLDRLR
jgi:hypothetical protein